MDVELNLDLKYINKINKIIKKIEKDDILTNIDKIQAINLELNRIDTSKLNKHLFYNSDLLLAHYDFVKTIKDSFGFDNIKKITNEHLIKIQKELESMKEKENIDEKNNKKDKTMIKDLVDQLNGVLRTSNIKDLIETYEKIKYPEGFIDIDEIKVFEENIYNLVLEEFDPMDIYELKRLIVKARETILRVYDIEKTNEVKKEEIKKEEIKKEDLVKFTIKDNTSQQEKNELNKMNEILEIFHTIAKPHIDSNTQPIILSEKEIGILNVIKKNLGSEEFSKLKIKWNPFVGLLIESKDGLNNENQKLIMSHIDLVPTFQKSHQEVKDGKRKSALTIGSDGLIRGSLDNTLPNAILLNNFVKNKFESNVSILFDRGEETGMWGASNFHNNRKEDIWYDVELNIKSLKLGLNQTEAPIFQKDLITINTDVTMPDVKNPYTFEVRDFSKDTKNKMKELFENAYISNYGDDDSTSAVKKDMKAFSYCISVGTKVSNKDNEYCFGGGCHSENTATSTQNILAYNDTFEALIKSINKEIEITIEKKPEITNKYIGSTFDDYLKYEDLINQYDENNIYSEDEYYKDVPVMIDIPKDDVVFEILRGILLEVDDGLDDLNEHTSLMLDDSEIEEITNELQSYVSSIRLEDVASCDTKQDLLNLIDKNMTDEEFENNKKKIMNFEDEEFEYEEFEEIHQSVVYEMIGEELYDFVYNVLLENVNSFTEEDFDEFAPIEMDEYEEKLVISKIKDKVSNIDDLKDIETFNDLVELLADNISKKEIEYFINDYEISAIIEM